MGRRALRGKLILAWALLVAAFAVATPASAQGISQTVYYRDGGSITLQIPVTASVGGRCEFGTGNAPGGSYDAGDISSAAWSNNFDFEISCNTASRVAIVSTNGGLLTTPAVTDSGYVTLAPYTVALNLVGDSDTAAASCDVASLEATAANPCSFRGPASNTDGLRLPGAAQNVAGSYLQVSAPAYAGPGTLVSGAYADTLTITIAAAP